MLSVTKPSAIYLTSVFLSGFMYKTGIIYPSVRACIKAQCLSKYSRNPININMYLSKFKGKFELVAIKLN